MLGAETGFSSVAITKLWRKYVGVSSKLHFASH